jgi:hypothetical protein
VLRNNLTLLMPSFNIALKKLFNNHVLKSGPEWTHLNTFFSSRDSDPHVPFARCCYITVDPETRASGSGVCLNSTNMPYNYLISQRLYDKR